MNSAAAASPTTHPQADQRPAQAAAPSPAPLGLPGVAGAFERLLQGPTGLLFVGLFMWVVVVQVWLKPESDAARQMYREVAAEMRLLREEIGRVITTAPPHAPEGSR